MARGNERFRLEREPLGGGAFGLVYRAHDTELDRKVAIKIPHDEDKERALQGEAKLMARIQELHEHHVVSLYDLHVIGGRRVLVMEYVEGESLRQKLGRIGEQHSLSAENAVGIAMQACLGLHTLHNAFRESGVFHRDVKPENILIRSSDGMVKIADFGIATILDASGMASTTAGTLPYMSPELLEGEGADYRADIYGLGVTTYEMLTGRLPFNPFDDAGKAKAPLVYGREICHGEAPAPVTVADVDKELSDIVAKAMHRQVNRRYESMQEFREALEGFHSRISVDSAIAAAWKQEIPEARGRELREVIRRFPANPKGYRNIAWFFNGQVRFPDAVKALEEGRVNCPGCGELMVDLALAYNQVGQIQRAIDTLKDARQCSLMPDMQKRTTVLLNTWRRRSQA
jgi:serine/threonine-protein kinase